MSISELIIALLIILIFVVLIINRKKSISYIKINMILLTFVVLLHFGRTYLPNILQLPINSFNITHHNSELTSFQGFKSFKKYSIENSEGTSLELEGFSKKKLFYDKEKDFFVLMDGIIFTLTGTEKTFNFNLTWAKAELTIDSKLIKEIDGTESYDYTFSPGFHHVKIKVYNTDTTSTKMYVSMSEYQPIISDQNITEALKGYLQKDTNLYYVYGFYEKKLKLKSSTNSTIAFLKSSSGLPVSWKISNCENANLKAVVYSGVGTTIKSDCKELLILRAKDIPEVTKLRKLSQCHDYAPMGFICQHGPDKFNELNSKIEKYTGRKLTGFTPSQASSDLTLPQIELNDEKYKQLDNIEKKIKEAKILARKRREDPFYVFKQSAWSKILKIDDTQIPLNKFRAFYMQSEHPDKVVYSEEVSRPSILYSSKEKFHFIDPDHFMGLWIGDFEFNKKTSKEITLFISWAKVKLRIDGKIIYDGGRSTVIPYTFTEGKHHIEIEYISNYGHINFLFDMIDPVSKIDNTFKTLVQPNTKIYLLGTYDSRREDHKLDIRLKESTEPVILFVASYEPIHWNIKNAKNLKAVVYNSYNPGSKITTDNPNTKIFYDKQLAYMSRLMPYCYDGPVIECEDKYSFQSSVDHIIKRTGRKPDGFSSTEIPSFSTERLKRLDNKKEIIIPQIILDDDIYEKINTKMKQLK